MRSTTTTWESLPKISATSGDSQEKNWTGKEMNVELNQAGVLAFKQVAEGYSFYAAR